MNSLCPLFTIFFFTTVQTDHIFDTHPDLLTGIKGCMEHSDCYINQHFVYCNEHQLCECNFGYSLSSPAEKNENQMQCMIYKCTEKEDNCAKYWNAVCDLNVTHQCTCPYGLTYSRTDRKCIPLAKIGGKCDETSGNKTSKCPLMAMCSKGECRCDISFIPIDDYNCKQIECINNTQCQSPNTICSSSTHRCACADGYKYNNVYTECTRSLLQDDCGLTADCGVGAVCQNRKCVCQQGFQESLKNSYECEPIHCKTDQDCSNRNDFSYCDKRKRRCKCSYDRSKDGSHCLKSLALIPLEEKEPERPIIIYIVIFIAAGSILIFVLSFIAYRLYPQTQRFND